jgi:hypothetical protein
MEKLNSLEGLRLAALKSKGYTSEQIAALTETLEGIFDDINKSLSTCEEHVESAHAPSNAEENVIVSIKRNGTAVAPKDKVVDISVPVKTSELENDSNFTTKTQLSEAVNGAGHLKAVIVSSLPSASSADQNTIYFVQKSDGESGNQYSEYKLVNGNFELIGEAKTDLSGYVKQTDVGKATDEQIQKIVDNAVAESEAYIGSGNLAMFWSLVRPLITSISLEEMNARVELLELAVFNGEIDGNPFYVTFESLDGVNAQGVWNQSSKRIEY